MKSISCRVGMMIAILLLALTVVNTTRCYSYTDVRVYGAVTDETGMPVPETSVTFISTSDTTGTMTDDSGMYSVTLSSVSTGVHDKPRPDMFLLHQNYPNPFNPETIISYELSLASQVKLDIYNIMGQHVRSLVKGYEEQGAHGVRWDGCDENGKGLAAGVYLYRLQAGNTHQTRKMLLMDGGTGSIGHESENTSYNIVSARKAAATADYTVVVKAENYVTYDDYNVPIRGDMQLDFSLQRKSDSTICGTVNYRECDDCIINNMGGIIHPFKIIVYDSYDYEIPLAETAIEYPDHTFEITGLPESMVDIVIQGDDIFAYKVSEKNLKRGENIIETKYITIQYKNGRLILGTSFFYQLKKAEYDSLAALEIAHDYGCKFRTSLFTLTTYAAALSSDRVFEIFEIIRQLNNDQRIYLAEPDLVIPLNLPDDFIDLTGCVR